MTARINHNLVLKAFGLAVAIAIAALALFVVFERFAAPTFGVETPVAYAFAGGGDGDGAGGGDGGGCCGGGDTGGGGGGDVGGGEPPPPPPPPPPPDFCPNLPGSQTSVPPGYTVDANGNCVTINDFCPNLPGIQNSLPPGYVKDANGNCVTINDFCPNLPGIQDSLPPGYVKDANGNCVTTNDFCPNLPGVQDSLPPGYVKDANGNCVTTTCTTNCGTPCTVNCGGGGLDSPNVYLFRKPGEQPLAFVTLAQIPYTGYETTALGAALFWMMLVGFAAITAYLIVVKRLPSRFVEHYLTHNERIALPHIDARDESNDAHAPAMTHVSHVAPSPMKVMRSILTTERPAYTAPTLSSVVRTPVAVAAARASEASDYVSMIPTFIGWIAKGESEKAFDFLRNLRLTQKSAQDFMEKTVCELDEAYRCRLETAAPANEYTTAAIASLSNSEVEQLIEALASAVDRSYGSEYTSAKIALVKALGVKSAALNQTIEASIATHAAPAAAEAVKPVKRAAGHADDFILSQITRATTH